MFSLTSHPSSAYGEFECTHDCTDLTSANFLNAIGKTTPLLLRISTVGPERGSADTVRDVHGWAMKMYTEEGNLDWVFNNTVSRWPDCVSLRLTEPILANIFPAAGFFRTRPDQVPVAQSLAQEAPSHQLSRCGHGRAYMHRLVLIA